MVISEPTYRLSQFCDALSNAVRLEIILLLRDNEWNVASLAEELDRDRSSVSRQLGKLSDHDLVKSETRGRKNFYSLKRPALIDDFLALQTHFKRE